MLSAGHLPSVGCQAVAQATDCALGPERGVCRQHRKVLLPARQQRVPLVATSAPAEIRKAQWLAVSWGAESWQHGSSALDMLAADDSCKGTCEVLPLDGVRWPVLICTTAADQLS